MLFRLPPPFFFGGRPLLFDGRLTGRHPPLAESNASVARAANNNNAWMPPYSDRAPSSPRLLAPTSAEAEVADVEVVAAATSLRKCWVGRGRGAGARLDDRGRSSNDSVSAEADGAGAAEAEVADIEVVAAATSLRKCWVGSGRGAGARLDDLGRSSNDSVSAEADSAGAAVAEFAGADDWGRS